MIYEYRISGVRQDEYDALDDHREEILEHVYTHTSYSVIGATKHQIPRGIINFGYVYRNEWIILKVKRGNYFANFITLDRLTAAESAAAAELFLTLEDRLQKIRSRKHPSRAQGKP